MTTIFTGMNSNTIGACFLCDYSRLDWIWVASASRLTQGCYMINIYP
jgi:hypothetical protein